eukprot:5600642-Ditylum_brightwellii.AAC.2
MLYKPALGCVTWFHATNYTCIELSEDAIFCKVHKFGLTIYCKALIAAAQHTQSELNTNT